MNLPELQQYAEAQAAANERAGELAAARLWRELAATAGQIIAMETRIAAHALEKASRIESWRQR